MIAITVISVVIVIVGTVAATRLSSIRVRRRRKLIELFTAAISDRSVAPRQRARLNLTASRFRQAAGADVAVLADYRKERIRRSRDPKAATAGLPRLARHHGTEPA